MDEFNNLLEADLAGRTLSVGQVVDGTVVQVSEEGIFVDIGAKSEGHLELDQIVQDELAKLQVGSTLKVRIIKKVNGEFKLSKKSVDFEEAWNKLKATQEANEELEVIVSEKVKNGYMAEAFGLLQGFIHHTNFKGRPNLGQGYTVRVLDLNRKARKLVFTRRDILDREYKESLERDYAVLQEGMVVEGVVDKLSPYGAFIRITDHLTGLLHISEFSWDHIKKPSEVLKAGNAVQVKILSIDKENNKISLSRKATMKDPLMTIVPGEEFDGSIESLAEFGAFVKLENGLTGLVHISELSFRKFGHPSELFKPGDSLRVKVLRIQPEDRRVSLSAKACERDPWAEVHSRFTVGQHVEGPVTQLLQSGMVMKLDEFFEAFVPISEISEERIKHPSDLFSEEDVVGGYVISVDSAKRRIRVSLRRTAESFTEEDKAASSRTKDSGPAMIDGSGMAGKVTLGDILGSKLDLKLSVKEEEEAVEETPAEEPAAAVEAVEETEAVVETEVETEAVEADDTAVEAEAVVEEAEVTEEVSAEEAAPTEEAEAEVAEPAAEEPAAEEAEAEDASETEAAE